MARRVVKSAEATALADHVRWVAAVWPGRTGFTCRPRHGGSKESGGQPELVIGHADYAADPAIASAVDALAYALETLGTAEALGYRLTVLRGDGGPPTPSGGDATPLVSTPPRGATALAQGCLF
jgi:hypothetical protein